MNNENHFVVLNNTLTTNQRKKIKKEFMEINSMLLKIGLDDNLNVIDNSTEIIEDINKVIENIKNKIFYYSVDWSK